MDGLYTFTPRIEEMTRRVPAKAPAFLSLAHVTTVDVDAHP